MNPVPPLDQPPLRPPPAPRCDWAYFFDVDGTLVDFADTPAAVRVSDALLQLLEDLYQCSEGALAIMSGRAIAEIDAFFPSVQLPAAGIATVQPLVGSRTGSRRFRSTTEFSSQPPMTAPSPVPSIDSAH